MNLELLRTAAAVAVLGGTATLGLGFTHAALAQPPTTVPCNTGDLIADMTGVNGVTLSLTPGCTYRMTESLPTVTHSLTIVGNNASIVRTRSADPFSIFVVSYGDLTLANVNVRNGGGDGIDGGAINMDWGTVNIYGGTFSDNNAIEYDSHLGDGGAIYNVDGALNVDGASFTDNSAEYGGVIFSDSACSTATLNHDSFIGNTAYDGGAIFNDDNNMRIGDGNFRYNSAEYGGAIYNDFTVTANDTLFAMNTASDEGGAIYNDGETVTLNRSLLIVNRATDGGGGIFNDNDGIVSLSSDMINANVRDNCDPTGTIDGCVG